MLAGNRRKGLGYSVEQERHQAEQRKVVLKN